jgi:dihydrofolate reductase
VGALKRDDGGDLHMIGSSDLVQTLIEHDLFDEFRLMVDPLVLGGGKRIFRDKLLWAGDSDDSLSTMSTIEE